MAEECSVYELEGFKNELEKLLNGYSGDELQRDSKTFCSEFCKLVEGFTCRWQVPLPQLRVLQIALCYFVQASSFFTSACDHVHCTLSSVALSVFELLLFFDQSDFLRDPLKLFSDTFQECNSTLARHQNVHMLQITHVVQNGGPWANSTLQAILSDSQLPQNEVDRYISSELPVFFELRVHYLLACERVSEAMALAKCCARHPTAGQHLFFLQVYLTWLWKTSQYEHLHKEVADLNGKDAVHIICNIESEEKDEILLALSTAFLSQQLRRGDMYYLWDLVFVWSKLHWRMNPSKQTLLEESHQLLLSATNVKSIFPFIRVILAELGDEGLQFCVELCANALQSCPPCDVVTKSLIYKTIANLLHNDLEVCRACALLVFFLERTVEAYKMVFLLYTHPDQEYHSEASPIGNHVRFEVIQILKKGLYFDPEFWSLIALRTNCLKLMSEKVLSAALEEIMEEKWVPNYCTKESTIRSNYPTNCQQGARVAHEAGAKKRHQKEDRNDVVAKRVKMRPVKDQPNADHGVKKKGKQGSQTIKETSSEYFRRSFWQPDKTQENFAQQFGYGECRRITRLSEQKSPKRKIKKPRWLLEDSGALENNAPPKVKKHKLRPQHQKQHRPSMIKSSGSGADKNNAKHTTSINSDLTAKEDETEYQERHSIDSLRSASPTEVILELSQPDNELTVSFNEDSFNRPRGHTQMLLYRPTVKPLVHPQPVKVVHRNEVILRARDTSSFVQHLHCYARRQKGKGVVSNMQVSFSTITRSSVQVSPPKVPPGDLCEKPVVEMKVTFASQTPAAPSVTQSPVKAVVSQTQTTAKISQAPTADGVSETTPPATVSPNPNTAITSQPPAADISQIPTSAKVSLSLNEVETSNIPAKSEMIPQSQDVVTHKTAPRTDESLSDGDIQQTCKFLPPENDKLPTDASIADTSEAVVMTLSHKDTDERKEPMDSDVPNVTEELENAKICSVSESTLNEVSAKDLEHMPSNDEVKENPADIDAETNAEKEAVPDETTVANGKTSEAEATCVPKEYDEEDTYANDEDTCGRALPTKLVSELTTGAVIPNTEDLKDPIEEDSTSVEVTPVPDSTSVEVSPVWDSTSVEVTPVWDSTSVEVTPVWDSTSVEVTPVWDSTSVEVTPVQDSTSVEVTPVQDSTSVEVTPVWDSTSVEVTPVRDSTSVEVTPVQDSTSLEVTPVQDSTSLEVTPVQDSTSLEVTPVQDSTSLEVTPVQDSTSLEVSPVRDSTSVEVSLVRDSTSVEVTPVWDSTSIEVTPVQDSTSVEVSPIWDSTSVEVTPVQDSASVEVSPVRDSTSVEVTSVQDSTSVEGTPVQDNTSVEVTPVQDSTSVEVSPVWDSTSVEVTSVQDSTSVEVTPVLDSTSVEVTPVRDSTSVEVTSVWDSTSVEVSSVWDSTSVEVTSVQDSTSKEVTPVQDGTHEEVIPVQDSTSVEVTPVQDSTSVEVTPVRDSTSVEVTSVLENMSTAPCKTMPSHSSPSTGHNASDMSVLQGKRGEEMIPQEDTQDIDMTTPENTDTVGTPQESGYTQDIAVTTPENSDPGGTPQESEESKLEYCCTICNKVFKGKRVVAHAMFHYRRDKCMFCGTLFKDDLLAMMHLSEHIEKLKKSKESPGPRNKAPENRMAETQEICANQSSAETITLSSAPLRRRGRPRKSVVNSEPMNPTEFSPSNSKLRYNPQESSPPDDTRTLPSKPPESSPPDDTRKLPSNSKPVDNQILHENRQNASKPCSGKTPVHNVNGHIGRRRVSLEKAKHDTLNVDEKQTTKPVEEILHPASNGAEEISLAETSELQGVSTMTPIQGEEESCSSSVDKIEKTKPEESPGPKAVTKQEEPAAIENTFETTETVCCPVDGCVWNADLSRNRVALLYHALEDHHGDVKPLELSFRVGNGRCSVCMRVLWSFQHYQDHVARHRFTPRHPCLHQGCGARFKTGIEMRRHTRKHSPLQAPCCLPGCSKLFICLWALNLHEREHYAITPTKTKTVKKTNEAQVVGEQEGCKPKEATVLAPDITVNKSQTSKAVEKLGGKQVMDNLSIGRDIEATPFGGLNEKDSNGTKNLSILSYKDTSTPATTIIDRLRLMLKRKTEKKHLSVHKVSTASLAITNGNMSNRLKNTQDNMKVEGPKRRGRPPGSTKLKKLLSNMKTIADQKADLKDKPVVLKEETDQSRGQVTLVPTPLSPSLNGNMRNRLMNTQDNMKVEGPKRRGRPPGSTKLKKMLSNMKTIAYLKDKPVVLKVETDQSRNQGTLAPSSLPPSLLEKTQTSQVSNEMNKTGDDGQQMGEKVTESSSTEELTEKSKTPMKKLIKKQCVNEEKDTLADPPKPSIKAADRLTETPLPPTSTAEETLKLTDEEKLKKLLVSKKLHIPKDKGTPTAPSNSSKVKKKTEATNPPESKRVKKGSPSKSTGISKPSETLAKVQVVTEDREVVQSHVGDMGKAKPMKETIDSMIGSPTPSNSSKAKNKQKATSAPEKKTVVKKGHPIKNPGLSKPSGKPAKSVTPAKVLPVTEDRGESHVADMEREKPIEKTLDSAIGSPAPSDSSNVKKRLKATHVPENKKVLKKVCPSKNTGPSKPSGKPAKSETPAKVQPVSEDRQGRHEGDMGKAKLMEETLDSTVGCPAPSKSTKLKTKRKATNTLENKMVKKVCPSKNPGLSKPSETPAKVQPVTENKEVQESHAGDMGKAKPIEVKLNSTIGSPGYSQLVNGHVVSNNEPQKDNVAASVQAEKAKAIPMVTPYGYGKRPFIRLPPTSYLDERYTTMPKRRKEVSMFHHSSLHDLRWPAEQALSVMPPQRQRCANCFISFSSAEELQTHLSLKECSTLFGFDSDDESNL